MRKISHILGTNNTAMNLILFDNQVRIDLLPLTFTRPIADLRIGILTIREKWEKCLGVSSSTLTVDYLSKKYPAKIEEENTLVNGSVCPTKDLASAIEGLHLNEALVNGDNVIAIRLDGDKVAGFDTANLDGYSIIEYDSDFTIVVRPWDVFSKNGVELANDFAMLTEGRRSQPLSDTNTLVGGGEIFLEEGAKVEASIINATAGPVYIGKNAEIMEGCIVRGPLAMCDHSGLKMGAKIYGATTLGPYSKVGGEVNNSVIIGYSNKGHDGFLGNSVLGEWVNIGADSNNSNLKNNYDEVKLWSYRKEGFVRTGLQFCGLIMGDHSKCGINTMFNTGTVVGVSSNIFGSGFPRNFVPSFAWGGAVGFSEYKMEKAMGTAERMMQRRGKRLEETDREIFNSVYNLTKEYRNF